MKEKIFISGPISSDLEHYKEKFDRAADLVQRAGFIPLNPAVLPIGMEPGDYMKITLAMLDTADRILFLDGWEYSDGAQLEHGYAQYIKKKMQTMSDFAKQFSSPNEKPMSRAERMFGPKEGWGKKEQPNEESNHQEGYRGFLLIHCPECGKIKGFCAKKAMTRYSCDNCGEYTDLRDLIPAHVNCSKCGAHFKYMTNIMTQEPIPYSCLDCHAIVGLQLNVKGTALTTVGNTPYLARPKAR